MGRESLADVFADLASQRGDFLVYDNGFLAETRTYADVARLARSLAARLTHAGIRKGDRIILWGENSPEWVACLWGAILAGVVVVPVDFRSSLDFVRTITRKVEARAVVVGRDRPDAGRHAANATGATFEGAPVWPMDEFDWHETLAPPGVDLRSEDTAEVMFTSGATADPRGVVLTHGNILASVRPIAREIPKYRKYARPFSPIRFLNLLPLSHMFGQTLATLIPPMLGGTTVFMRSVSPPDIIDQIRRRRVSVLVCVPKMLQVLRGHLERTARSAATPASMDQHWVKRWWQHRDVHRMLGLKFWCCTVGAAPLDPELEQFWAQLGFLVVQGYGLTETAPIVALNHPFSAHRGSVGKPLPGLELKLGDGGEILVRGENVTSGYFGDPQASAAAFEDGWLRTGDIGELDAEGRLYVRGRKKEMIVRSDGLNVFPDDVERELNAVPGVRESAVVGMGDPASERVHAVVVLDEGADVDDVVAAANERLANHQKIRTASVWTGGDLPRTEGTKKLKRVEIRRRIQGESASAGPSVASDPIEQLLAGFAPGRALGGATTMEELGLTSLDRVELMVAMEQRFGATIDEGRFAEARDLASLKRLIEAPASGAPATQAIETVPFPSWNRSRAARATRRVMMDGLLLPLSRIAARLDVAGLEHLAALDHPVVFAANHLSHFDTPAILAALPRRWRARVAPAMAKEFFRAHFFPGDAAWRDRAVSSLLYYLAALCFNAFPLPQREAGARETLRYIGELATAGYSPLIFPEGERSQTGGILSFRPGIGMIASRLSIPVVPVRLDGADRILPKGSWRINRGVVRVRFGAPLRLHGDRYADLANTVEDAVRKL